MDLKTIMRKGEVYYLKSAKFTMDGGNDFDSRPRSEEGTTSSAYLVRALTSLKWGEKNGQRRGVNKTFRLGYVVI